MQGEIKYAAIISKLENGKFQITFPDFDGLSTIAEKEENIEINATNLLNYKLQELKTMNKSFPNPSSAFDIQSKLKEGEITLYILAKSSIKKSFNTSDLSKENIGKTLNATKTNFKNLFSKNANNKHIFCLTGLITGIVYLIASILPVISGSFFGISIKFGFFQGMFSDLGFIGEIPDLRKLIIISRTLGFLLIFVAIYTIYSHYKEDIFNMFASTLLSTLMFLITFFTVLKAKMQINAEAAANIFGFSYGIFFLFIATIVLIADACYLWLNHKEEIKK